MSEILLFVIELGVTVALPLISTLNALQMSPPDGPKAFKKWTFYWFTLAFLTASSEYWDYFEISTLLKFIVLIVMLIPQQDFGIRLFNILEA